jgi:hypothetical protein
MELRVAEGRRSPQIIQFVLGPQFNSIQFNPIQSNLNLQSSHFSPVDAVQLAELTRTDYLGISASCSLLDRVLRI